MNTPPSEGDLIELTDKINNLAGETPFSHHTEMVLAMIGELELADQQTVIKNLLEIIDFTIGRWQQYRQNVETARLRLVQ